MPPPTTPRRLRPCPTCGLIQAVPDPPPGGAAWCARCRRRLPDARRAAARNTFAAAAAVAAGAIFPAAIGLPFLRIERLGHATERSLVGGVVDLIEHGHVVIAAIIVVFSLVLPPVKLALIVGLSTAAGTLSPAARGRLHRLVEQTGRWGMLDVLLVAVLIALVKLGDLVTFTAGPGLLLFAGFVLTSLVASMTFDPHALWETGMDGTTASPPDEPGSAATAPPGPDAGREADAPPSTPQAGPAPAPTDPASPAAILGRPRRWYLLAWLIPVAVAGVVVAAVYVDRASAGPTVEVRFEHAHGLKPGDALIHRGTAVGAVESVRLDERLTDVLVAVRLDPRATAVAVEGSRFWIVRPRLDVAAVTGLETVVGAKYLEVLVGPENAPPMTVFLGLEEPPVVDLFEPGGRDLILTVAEPRGLRPGSPIFYRSIRVGGVTRVGLTGDGSLGEVRGYIRPAYRQLIREGTRFWSVGGVRLSAGVVGGVSLDVGPLETLLHGGIALAVPEEASPVAAAERRFTLEAAPEPEWLAWRPQVLLDETLPSFPSVRRAKLTWTQTRLFLSRELSRTGWGVPLAAWPGREVGPGETLTVLPADLVVVEPTADGGQARLTLGAEPSFPLTIVSDPPPAWTGATDGLVLLTRPAARPESDESPPASEVPAPATVAHDREVLTADRLRPPGPPEDLWLAADDDQAPLFLAAMWLEPAADGGWTVLADYPRSRDLAAYHGVPAVAAGDGRIVGWLLASGEARRIATVTPPTP